MISKDQAIEIFTTLIDEYKSVHKSPRAWLIKVDSFTKEIFSEKSTEYKQLIEILKYQYHGDIDYAISMHASYYIDVLPAFIETVKVKGVYSEPVQPKVNFLSNIKNELLIGYIATSIATVFIGGTLWGKMLSDNQNIKLEMKVKSLQDTIITLSVPSANKNTNTDTHSSTNKNDSTNQ